MTAGIITPLPQESEEKVHYSAENCKNTSHSMSASPSVASLLSQLTIFSFLSFFSFFLTDKTFPPSPSPTQAGVAAYCSKTPEKKPLKKKRKSHTSMTVHSHLILLDPVDPAVSFAVQANRGKQCLSDTELHRGFSFSLCDWS